MSTLSSFFHGIGARDLPPVHPPVPPDARQVSILVLKEIFRDSADFQLRPVWPGGEHVPGVWLCWIDGLVDAEAVSEQVLRPLTEAARFRGAESDGARFRLLEHGAVFSCTAQTRQQAGETAEDLLRGNCAVVFDKLGSALCFEVKNPSVRPVGQPTVEKSVKGSKDAFVETLRINTALLRRRLRTPELELRQMRVGRRSGTAVTVVSLRGITKAETLETLLRRLENLDIDGLLAAGQLEQYLTDCPASPFPQLLHTERPDKFAEELLNGRVGLLADGLPMGFLLPATLPAALAVAEDRGQHFLLASALRLLRWLALGLGLLFPALFVAVAMYHQEMIPTRLLLSMIAAKQDVPFSVATEVLGMLLAFELLMEAGLRLPDPVGDTVSIIGALIVGQSAVEARIVSPIAVIVVAAAAICGFLMPSRDLAGALRLARLALVLLAIFLGLLGIVLGLCLLLLHLGSLESFGLAYLAPLSEGGFGAVLKALLRPPLPGDKLRQEGLHGGNRRNQK